MQNDNEPPEQVSLPVPGTKLAPVGILVVKSNHLATAKLPLA